MHPGLLEAHPAVLGADLTVRAVERPARSGEELPKVVVGAGKPPGDSLETVGSQGVDESPQKSRTVPLVPVLRLDDELAHHRIARPGVRVVTGTQRRKTGDQRLPGIQGHQHPEAGQWGSEDRRAPRGCRLVRVRQGFGQAACLPGGPLQIGEPGCLRGERQTDEATPGIRLDAHRVRVVGTAPNRASVRTGG